MSLGFELKNMEVSAFEVLRSRAFARTMKRVMFGYIRPKLGLHTTKFRFIGGRNCLLAVSIETLT